MINTTSKLSVNLYKHYCTSSDQSSSELQLKTNGLIQIYQLKAKKHTVGSYFGNQLHSDQWCSYSMRPSVVKGRDESPADLNNTKTLPKPNHL